MINQDSILIFGATGNIGKSLINRFTQNNYKVIAVTRNIHRNGHVLRTTSNYGWLEMEEINSFSPEKISSLMRRCSICINLIGILNEKKKDHFKTIHTDFPLLLSKIAKEKNLKQFIHISVLGIENAKVDYAISKINGENLVKKNFDRYIILKPSICYSSSDQFTTKIFSLLNFLPIMPLYYEGKTKFTPIHVTDMAEIIYQVVRRKIIGETIECIGPEVFSFKEIILKLLKAIDKKRPLIPIPLSIAKLVATVLEKFPKPLITKSQLNLLQYDNVKSGKYKTNFNLGIEANKKFEEEIEKYSFNWKTGGQFSKKNLSQNS